MSVCDVRDPIRSTLTCRGLWKSRLEARIKLFAIEIWLKSEFLSSIRYMDESCSDCIKVTHFWTMDRIVLKGNRSLHQNKSLKYGTKNSVECILLQKKLWSHVLGSIQYQIEFEMIKWLGGVAASVLLSGSMLLLFDCFNKRSSTQSLSVNFISLQTKMVKVLSC